MPRRYIDRIYLREPVPADSYLSALPAVRALGDREHPLLFPAGVTFLVGENGTGKSTLLEAVAVAGHPELRLLHPGHPLPPP